MATTIRRLTFAFLALGLVVSAAGPVAASLITIELDFTGTGSVGNDFFPDPLFPSTNIPFTNAPIALTFFADTSQLTVLSSITFPNGKTLSTFNLPVRRATITIAGIGTGQVDAVNQFQILDNQNGIFAIQTTVPNGNRTTLFNETSGQFPFETFNFTRSVGPFTTTQSPVTFPSFNGVFQFQQLAATFPTVPFPRDPVNLVSQGPVTTLSITVGPAAVPEPSTMILAATALPAGLGYWLRRRKPTTPLHPGS